MGSEGLNAKPIAGYRTAAGYAAAPARSLLGLVTRSLIVLAADMDGGPHFAKSGSYRISMVQGSRQRHEEGANQAFVAHVQVCEEKVVEGWVLGLGPERLFHLACDANKRQGSTDGGRQHGWLVGWVLARGVQRGGLLTDKAPHRQVIEKELEVVVALDGVPQPVQVLLVQRFRAQSYILVHSKPGSIRGEVGRVSSGYGGTARAGERRETLALT